MIKHKKTLSVFTVLALLIVTGLIFIDPIIQKTANSLLDPINKDFSLRLIDLDLDLTKGRARFSLKATDRNTGRTIVDIKKFVADLDLKGMKVIINDADLTASSKLLEMLQHQEDDDKSRSNKASPYPLGLLSVFELNNLTITLPDAGIVSSIGKILINVEEGYGLIQGVSGEHLPSDLKFLTIPRVSLNFGKDFFVKEKKDLSLTFQSPSFKVNQDLLHTFQKEFQGVRQAQTEKENYQGSKTSPLTVLKRLQIQNLGLDLFGSKDLYTKIDQIQIDFLDGQGTINNLATRTTDSVPLMNINSIKFRYDPQGLTGKGSAKFKVNVSGADINIMEKAADVLGGLPKMPAMEAQEENGPELVTELSKITIENTTLSLKEQGLLTSIRKVEVFADQGKLIVKDVTGQIEQNRREFLKLNLISASFEPSQLKGPGKPQVDVIVTDFHIKVGKDLLNRLRKEKPSKDEPQSMPFSIKSLLIGASSIGLTDFPGIGSQKYLTINDFFGNMYNINLGPGAPLGDFNFTANLDPETKMLANGSIDLARDPYEWSVNFKLLNLDMRKFNEEIRKRIPLTFKEGVFNFFGEAIRKDDRIIGYYKPFLVDAEYAGDKADYQGLGHFFAEGFATIANFLFERSDRKSVATKVPFVIKDGKMNVKVGKAVLKAVEHGLTETERVKPDIDKQLRLKEAQEEK